MDKEKDTPTDFLQDDVTIMDDEVSADDIDIETFDDEPEELEEHDGFDEDSFFPTCPEEDHDFTGPFEPPSGDDGPFRSFSTPNPRI